MLDELRKDIQFIDKEIFTLLEKRFKITNKIALFKKENNVDIENLKVEEIIISKAKKNFNSLDSIFIEDLYKLIINESKKKQKELINN